MKPQKVPQSVFGPIHNIFLLASNGDLILGYNYLSMWFFVFGMCLFGAVHLILTHYLTKLNRIKPDPKILNCIFLMSLLLSLFFPVLSYLVIPISIYALILSKLLAETLINLNNRCNLGCFLFIISDVILLFELIFGYWGLTLPIYWLSLALIASSL